MPRSKNSLKTVQVTVSMTEITRGYLEALTEHGMYGKNAAETANMLVQEKLRELKDKGTLPPPPAVPAPIES